MHLTIFFKLDTIIGKRTTGEATMLDRIATKTVTILGVPTKDFNQKLKSIII